MAKFGAVSATFGRFPGEWDSHSEAQSVIDGAINPMWHNSPEGGWTAPQVVELES
jgi:hypothetical protein